MNNISIIGNLTKNPALRYTPSGTAVAEARIAVDHYAGGKPRTDYFNFTVWGKRAEALAKEMHKGSKVAVTGALCTDPWTDSDGNKRYKTWVEATSVDFLVWATPSTNGAGGDEHPATEPATDEVPAPVELAVVPT